jgi:hypothetical protein
VTGTAPSDEGAIAAAVAVERRSVCDLLDTLGDDDWSADRLCADRLQA